MGGILITAGGYMFSRCVGTPFPKTMIYPMQNMFCYFENVAGLPNRKQIPGSCLRQILVFEGFGVLPSDAPRRVRMNEEGFSSYGPIVVPITKK